LLPRFTKFFVLQFKLDLMNGELMNEFLQVHPGPAGGFSGRVKQERLSLPTKSASVFPINGHWSPSRPAGVAQHPAFHDNGEIKIIQKCGE